MSQDIWNQYIQLMHEHAEKGDWDSAIKYAKKVPSNWSAFDQLPQHNIPPHAFEKVLNAVPKNDRANFHFELSSNLHPDLTHEQLDLLHSRIGEDGYAINNIQKHPNYNKHHPVEMGKKAASEFWRSYERRVEPQHFAAVKSAFGDGQPVEMTDHRGNKGHSHDANITDGFVYDKTSNTAASGPRHYGNSFIANLGDVHPHLKQHAKDVQNKILEDENIEKKTINGKIHILLHRGVGGKYANDILRSAGYDKENHTAQNKTIKVKKAPFSSWTTDKEIAKQFASSREMAGYKKPTPSKHQRLIVSKWIPLEHVIHSGSHRVHIGQEHAHPAESEIVVHHPEGHMKIHASELEPWTHTVDGHAPPKILPKEKKLKKSEELSKNEFMPHKRISYDNKTTSEYNSPADELSALDRMKTPRPGDESERMYLATASNHPETLSRLIKEHGHDPTLMRTLVDNPNIDENHLDEFINHPDASYSPAIRKVIGHSKVQPKQLHKLSEHEDPYVRKMAAEHPKATQEHINQAILDEEPEVVKAAIGAHANKLSDTQTKDLLSDNHDIARTVIQNRSHLNDDHIAMALKNAKAGERGDVHTREEAYHMLSSLAKHPSVGADHLTNIMKEASTKLDPEKNTSLTVNHNETILSSVLKNPNHTKEHLDHALQRNAFHIPDHVLEAAINSKHITDDQVNKIKDETDSEHIKDHIQSIRPQSDDHVHVSMGTHKLRQMRDYIKDSHQKAAERMTLDRIKQKGFDPEEHGLNHLISPTEEDLESAPKTVHKKDLEKQGFNLQNLTHLFDARGNISHEKLQEHIEAQPKTTYGVTHDTWKGAQRHSNEKQKVFQLNYTQDHVNQMREAGVFDTFKNINSDSKQSGHPVRGHTLGWVRYNMHDGEVPGGIHVDEIQSDFGSHLVKQVKAQAQAAKESGQISHEQANQAIERAESRYPHAHLQKINEILFGGKHPSEVIHEAFKQHMRDKGHHDQHISMFQAKPKSVISGQDTGKALPVHMQETYGDQPKKMGYKPAEYGIASKHGYVAHQDNPAHLKSPTWIDKVRKFEKINEIFDALYKSHCRQPLQKNEALKTGKVTVPYKRPSYKIGAQQISHETHHENQYPPGYHFHDDQKKLIHGLDLANKIPVKRGASADKYQVMNSSGKDTIMKHAHGIFKEFAYDPDKGTMDIGHYHHELSPAHREVLYHNAAHQIFNMGHVVPTTGIVKVNGQDHSVQEWSQGDIAMSRSPWEDSRHKEAYNQLDHEGTIDKMSIMNVAMGNHDRHAGNYLLHTDDTGKHHVKLIDNGGAFEYPETTTLAGAGRLGDKDLPDYHDKAEENKPLHPNAARMLHGISHPQVKEFFSNHGISEEHPITQNFLRRVQAMKDLHTKDPNVTRHELLSHAILETGGKVEDTARSKKIASGKSIYDKKTEVL